MSQTPDQGALLRQRDIYLGGAAGQRPRLPVGLDALEAAADRVLPPAAFAYLAGGAGTEATLAHNRSAFERWRIRPRMLRDVSQRDLGIELLGRRLPAPLLLAPIGVLELAHREADHAVGRAAAALGLPFIFSNQASVPMEAVAASMGDGPRWFQLYWSKSDALTASLVSRAEACGCDAIVVTLDTTMLGWRQRDLDLAYLPFLQGMGIAQYTSDPVFQQLLDAPEPAGLVTPPRRVTLHSLRTAWAQAQRYPGPTWTAFRSGRALRAVRTFINTYSNPALTWAHLATLRGYTRLPILLKGILDPDDARRAVDAGMDGLIVSNHGGRQVDGAISAIEALPDVVAATGGQIPVLMDSGIRSGADVFKALALGAQAVCVGRPYAYGLALAGEAGVREVLANLLASFDLTMGLAGCRSVAEITPDCLVS